MYNPPPKHNFEGEDFLNYKTTKNKFEVLEKTEDWSHEMTENKAFF